MRFRFLLPLFVPFVLQAQLVVAVSLQPQVWFVEKIAGDRAEVVVMIPPGSSPHSYEPRPAQMAALSDADLYLAIGVSFEKAWMDRFVSANRQMVVVQTDALINKRAAPRHHHHDEEHAHEHEAGFMDRVRTLFNDDHGHEAIKRDDHIWTSPQLALLQARAIYRALSTVDPDHAKVYRENYQALIERVVALDLTVAQMLAPYAGRAFLIHHPAWGYFAADYDLVQVAVEVDGKEPKPAQLQRLIHQSRDLGFRTVFVQPQIASSAAETIAETIGGEVVRIDPLAYEWEENILQTARALKKAFDDADH